MEGLNVTTCMEICLEGIKGVVKELHELKRYKKAWEEVTYPGLKESETDFNRRKLNSIRATGERILDIEVFYTKLKLRLIELTALIDGTFKDVDEAKAA